MASGSSDGNRRRSVRIGKYEVVKHIATGGMGAVYRAVDTELNREVALKVLSPEMALKPELVKRFQREARSAARLSHENIVRIYEFGDTIGTYYLALEYVDGLDLHQYVSTKGKLEAEDARQIIMQATQALVQFHKAGLVHRDIKPSNFLLTTKEGRRLVKLTDLGLARGLRDEEDSRLTRDGTTLGTVDYLPPEQARNSSAADIRSDIYALGCTFYHLLAGQPPFPGGSIPERICKHMEAEPPDIRGLNETVPPGLAAVLRRMLAKKPEDRFQTPAELLEALANPEEPEQAAAPSPEEALAVLAQLAGVRSANPAPTPSTSVSPSRPRKRRLQDDKPAKKKATKKDSFSSSLLWVAGVAAALVVTMTVGLLLEGGRHKPPGDDSKPASQPAGQIPVPAPRTTGPEKNSSPEKGKPPVEPVRKGLGAL